MSIQEVNGKGPKKRKKSLEIFDSEGRERSEPSVFPLAPVSQDEAARATEPGVQLLHWRDMPQHLQFNPYVLTGYRPLQSLAGCVCSLFYFHNETINILTHGKSIYLLLHNLANNTALKLALRCDSRRRSICYDSRSKSFSLYEMKILEIFAMI